MKKIERGGMWEDSEWEIHFDEECSGDKDMMCPHCHSFRVLVKPTAYPPRTYDWPVFICPRVVVARNEGGCNTTGVCLDCILEAATL